jgi:hypothetical protein
MNNLGWGGEAFHKLAAYSEFAISMVSFYGVAATVLNTHFGYAVLPIGAPFGSMHRKSMALKK